MNGATAMKFWAIKHTPTGFYLPNPQGRSGRGGTHTEPTDPRIAPPRLFTKEVSAKAALRWWLAGRATKKVEFASFQDIWGDYQDEVHSETIKVESVVERRPEDMKVVLISLHVD